MKTLHIKNGRIVAITLTTDKTPDYGTRVDVADNFAAAVGDAYSLAEPASNVLPWPVGTTPPKFHGYQNATWLATANNLIAQGFTGYGVGSTVVIDGVTYTLSNGAFSAASGGGGGVVARITTQEGASRSLTSADNGSILECTANITLTVPPGLPAGFRCVVLPFGTTSVAFSGTTGNGAATTITRAATANQSFGIVKRASGTEAFLVDGV